MTEPHRTVAAERDLPRVRQWIEDAVRHAVNDAAQALNSIRYLCDHAETHELCPGKGDDCDACSQLLDFIERVRALLPALPEPNRRAESGEEVTGMGSDFKGGDEEDREL